MIFQYTPRASALRFLFLRLQYEQQRTSDAGPAQMTYLSGVMSLQNQIFPIMSRFHEQVYRYEQCTNRFVQDCKFFNIAD